MTETADISLEDDLDRIDAHDARGERAERRVRRHLDTIWQREAAVRDAWNDSRRSLDDYVRTVDYTLRMVEIEMELASAILTAETAADPGSFAAAVDHEIEGWKLYIERLQARAASRSDASAADAEDAVRELRRRNAALAQRLAELRDGAPDEWRERRASVLAASMELERAVDAVSATFD